MARYSTRQAVKQLGISLTTLNRYIAANKVPIPPITEEASINARLWSDYDIARVREILPKIANGRKTRYKKQSAVTKQQSAKTKPRKPKKR